MKLQQLRYVVEVFRRNLNVSEAADALFTSQPGVSKQIRLLEDELGVQIFIRSGKRIVAVTPAGLSVLEMAEQVLRHVQNIKHIGDEFSDAHQGVLNIAATHHMLHFRLQAALRQMNILQDRQAVAQRRQIARPCRTQRNPRGNALDVGYLFQAACNIIAPVSAQGFHRIQPRLNVRSVAQRMV